MRCERWRRVDGVELATVRVEQATSNCLFGAPATNQPQSRDVALSVDGIRNRLQVCFLYAQEGQQSCLIKPIQIKAKEQRSNPRFVLGQFYPSQHRVEKSPDSKTFIGRAGPSLLLGAGVSGMEFALGFSLASSSQSASGSPSS
jgi:hypothetical protein